MSGETQLLMEQLMEAVKRTQEYNQYQTLLESVKKHPDIYRRIGEFRRGSIVFQMTDHANPIEENNALQKEFADLQTNGLANEFLAAEHRVLHDDQKDAGIFSGSSGSGTGVFR